MVKVMGKNNAYLHLCIFFYEFSNLKAIATNWMTPLSITKSGWLSLSISYSFLLRQKKVKAILRNISLGNVLVSFFLTMQPCKCTIFLFFLAKSCIIFYLMAMEAKGLTIRRFSAWWKVVLMWSVGLTGRMGVYFLHSVQVLVTVCSWHQQTPQLIHCSEADV